MNVCVCECVCINTTKTLLSLLRQQLHGKFERRVWSENTFILLQHLGREFAWVHTLVSLCEKSCEALFILIHHLHSSSWLVGVLISSISCWNLPWSSLILVDVCGCWCSYVYLLIYCFLMLLEFSLGCWIAVIAWFFYPSTSHYFDLKILYVGVNMFMCLLINFHNFWWRFDIFKNSWQICPVLEHVMIFWKHWNLPFFLI